MDINRKFKLVEEIPVWQKAHELCILVYKLTKNYPKNELYGLTSQYQRCIVSVPANITEGFYRQTIKELLQFLYVARGSLGEAKYYTILSRDLRYIKEVEYTHVIQSIDNIGKQLNGWIKSLRKIK